MVADSGKYVVTFGDWEQNDSLPLVIYGPQGDIRKLLTADTRFADMGIIDGDAIVLGDDFMHALVYFGPDDKTLFIRLDRDHTIRLWLETGEVMDGEWFTYSEPGAAMSCEDRDALDAFSEETCGGVGYGVHPISGSQTA